VVPVNQTFQVKSIHGNNAIDKECIIHLFNTIATFFILPNLTTFDGIIGLDLLKQTDGELNFKNKQLSTNSRNK